MAALPTEHEFSQHLNTKYRVNVEAPKPVELELVEVKSYVHKNNPTEEGGMERFSIYFRGPDETFLPQGMYSINHEFMGDLELFLVPVEREELGFRYEAVFNFRIEQ